MSDVTLIFAAGCTIFALVTLTSLWTGYLLLQRAWVAQNPEVTSEGDKVPTLLAGNETTTRNHESVTAIVVPVDD